MCAPWPQRGIIKSRHGNRNGCFKHTTCNALCLMFTLAMNSINSRKHSLFAKLFFLTLENEQKKMIQLVFYQLWQTLTKLIQTWLSRPCSVIWTRKESCHRFSHKATTELSKMYIQKETNGANSLQTCVRITLCPWCKGMTYFQVFTVKNICIFRAVHENFGPLAILGAPAVPPLGLVPVAHGSPLTACVPHCVVSGRSASRWLTVRFKQMLLLKEAMCHFIN